MYKSVKSNYVMLLTGCLMAVFFCGTLKAQHAETVSWGGTSYDNQILASAVTDDDGFVALFGTANFTLDGVGLQVNKFDSNGRIEWSKHIQDLASSRIIHGHSIIQTSDLGYVIVGEDLSFEEYRNFAIKLDRYGDLMWNNAIMDDFTMDNSASFHGVAEDAEGNIILAGSQMIADQEKGLVVKLDRDGLVLWSRTYTIHNENDFSKVALDNAGNIFVIGTYYNELFDNGILIMKLHPDGNITWAKDIKSDKDTLSFNPLKIGFNNNMIFYAGVVYHTGRVKNPESPESLPYNDGFLIYSDTDGNISDSKIISGGKTSIITDLLPEGNSIYTAHYADGIYLSKINANNDVSPVEWTRAFGRENDESFSIIKNNNHIILTGLDRSSGKQNIKGEALTLAKVIGFDESANHPCASVISTALAYEDHTVSVVSPFVLTDTSYNTRILYYNISFELPFDTAYCSPDAGRPPVDNEPLNLRLYPNPSHNHTILRFNNSQELDFDLFILNNLGQKIGHIEGQGEELTINTEDLAASVYYLHLILENGPGGVVRYVKY